MTNRFLIAKRTKPAAADPGAATLAACAELAACTDLIDFLDTRGRYDHEPLLLHLAGRNGPRVRMVQVGPACRR